MNRLPSQERVLGHYLAVQHPPLLPEVALWLVAGHVDLEARCQELLEGGRAPYWAFCWGSGQALARHLLDHPQLVAGQRVVDFGAGSGVAGIAAALAGAATVTAVDTDDTARRFARLNAELNGVSLEVTDTLPLGWDVMLASDVLYEPALANWLQGHARTGQTLYVSDPLRPGNARLDAEPLAWIDDARTFPDVDPPIHRAALYRLGPIRGETP